MLNVLANGFLVLLRRNIAVFQSGLFFEAGGTYVCTVRKNEVSIEQTRLFTGRYGITIGILKSERGHAI